MKTTDLFKFNRSAKRLNESMAKNFGTKINLESFDLPKLQDARNKLRTQLSQVRSESGFNETTENDAYSKAQFMLDAINAEIAERNEFIVTDEEVAEITDSGEYDREGEMAGEELSTAEDAAEELKSILTADENLPEWVQAKITKAVDYLDTARDYMASKDDNNEQFGESMTKLREGEIQQASAIVTAKTMVDRVGRWIEELSGMENDTLLQLGDSIRDEMGQEQAKQFISACAPAIQAALQNLKDTREALASSVRGLTGEEQAAGMLGGEPGMEAEPDAMNAAPADAGEGEDDIAFGPPEDDFAAAEPAAGGMEAAGREKRESIERGNSLLRVLAG